MRKSAAIAKIEDDNLRLQPYAIRAEDQVQVLTNLLGSEQEAIEYQYLMNDFIAPAARRGDIALAIVWYHKYLITKHGEDEALDILEAMFNTPAGKFLLHIVQKFAQEMDSKGYSKILDEIASDTTVKKINKAEIYNIVRRYTLVKVAFSEIKKHYGDKIKDAWADCVKFFHECKQYESQSQPGQKINSFQLLSSISKKKLSNSYRNFFKDIQKFMPGFSLEALDIMIDARIELYLEVEHYEKEYFKGILDLIQTKKNKKQSNALALIPLFAKSHSKVKLHEDWLKIRKEAILSKSESNSSKVRYPKQYKLDMIREIYAIAGES